jgi:hypothetical protein
MPPLSLFPSKTYSRIPSNPFKHASHPSDSTISSFSSSSTLVSTTSSARSSLQSQTTSIAPLRVKRKPPPLNPNINSSTKELHIKKRTLHKALPEVPPTPRSPAAFVPAKFAPLPPLESWIDLTDDDLPSPASFMNDQSTMITSAETPNLEDELLWATLVNEAEDVRVVAKRRDEIRRSASMGNMAGKFQRFRGMKEIDWSNRRGSHFDFD